MIYGWDKPGTKLLDLSKGAAMVFILSLVNLSGCQKKADSNSDVDFMTPEGWNCLAPAPARLAYVKSILPAGFLSGYTGDKMDTAINLVANIPDRDLNYLIWSYNQHVLQGISPAGLSAGVQGLTHLVSGQTQSGFKGKVATSIATSMQDVAVALQHEIGHGVEIVAREAAVNTQFADFDTALQKINAEASSKGSLIRNYAKSSQRETWAEAYQQMYCSPESNQFVSANLPYTYSFLSAVLAPPMWATETTNSGSTSVSNSNWFDGIILWNANYVAIAGANPSSFEGWWNSLLGSLPANNNAVTSAMSSNSQPAAPFNQTAIAIALMASNASLLSQGVVLASAPEVTVILLCLSDNSDCVNHDYLGQLDKGHILRFSQQSAGRNFYSPQNLRSNQADIFNKSWILRGFNDAGALISKRMIKFAAS